MSSLYFATPGPLRPLGVTILVTLQIIAGIVDIVIGLLLAFVYAVAATIFGVGLHGFAILLLPWSLLFFAVGIFSFILAYGLWTGKGWAWTFSIILALVGLGISTIGLFFGDYSNVIPMIFYTLILIYLTTYSVRAFFGRAYPYPMPYPAYAPPSLPYAQQSPPQYSQPAYYPAPPTQPLTNYRPPSFFQRRSGPLQRTMMCPVCLSPTSTEAPYCPRCGTRLR